MSQLSSGCVLCTVYILYAVFLNITWHMSQIDSRELPCQMVKHATSVCPTPLDLPPLSDLAPPGHLCTILSQSVLVMFPCCTLCFFCPFCISAGVGVLNTATPGPQARPAKTDSSLWVSLCSFRVHVCLQEWLLPAPSQCSLPWHYVTVTLQWGLVFFVFVFFFCLLYLSTCFIGQLD